MDIIWTKHGEERQQQWQQKRPEITREEVETVLSYPEQVVAENDVLVAQSKFGKEIKQPCIKLSLISITFLQISTML
jgi:hypothetical protein